jgi:cytochrome c553
MRLITTSFSIMALGATAALSGGGKVTSTEPGPPSLTVTSTEQMLDTMGITPAAATTTEAVEIAKVAVKANPPAKVTYRPPPPAPFATPEAGEIKVTEAPKGPLDPRETIKQCSTCHGVDGIAKIPTAPNIAGSSRQYLETQLKAFRSGKRENEVMGVIAEGMSNAEIKAAAKWYASLKVTVEVPE